MKKFQDLQIRVKLIISFIILSVLTGVVGFIGITNMSDINNRGNDMFHNNFVSSQQLSEFQINLNIMRTNYLLMLYENDLSKLEERVNEISTKSIENDSILQVYDSLIKTQEDRNLFKATMDSLELYRKVGSEHIALVENGQYEEAKDRLNEFDQARVALNENVYKLIDYNITTARNSADMNESEYNFQSNLLIYVIVISILVALALGLAVSGMISKPVNELVEVATKIADGDLDVEIKINSKDEIGILAQVFRNVANNLNEIMSNINAASDQVAVGAKQLSDSSIALSQGATEQASSVEELSASLEEISVQTKENAQNADTANRLAESTKEDAMQGKERMDDLIKAMEEIDHSSHNISKIIKVIDEIAFQTNILALNAAVEAARAGSHGKGFAVVAEEVRNLAARSANAAKETTVMIEDSIKIVEVGTKLADSTSSELNKIVDEITQVAQIVKDISDASNEQAVAVGQVNQGIMQVSEVVQTNSSTSEEGAAASEELSGQAQLLKEQVSKFKLRKQYPDQQSHRKGKEELNSDMIKMLDQMKAKKSNRITLCDDEFGKY